MAVKKCLYPESSGYETVEVVLGICEVGQGCDGLKAGCPRAWKDSDKERTETANKVYDYFCKELEAKV